MLPGACVIKEGNQVIDQGYPDALSRYTQDFLLLYAFLPALVLLGVITFKIRDRIIRRWPTRQKQSLTSGAQNGERLVQAINFVYIIAC